MSVKSERMQSFIKNFQEKIIQGRRLLKIGNHKWADKTFTDLYFEIEKTDWLDSQKSIN
ncbi:MAG: hypothetical protein ACTSVV_18000 [Promethearchaeota archaeon]